MPYWQPVAFAGVRLAKSTLRALRRQPQLFFHHTRKRGGGRGCRAQPTERGMTDAAALCTPSLVAGNRPVAHLVCHWTIS